MKKAIISDGIIFRFDMNIPFLALKYILNNILVIFVQKMDNGLLNKQNNFLS